MTFVLVSTATGSGVDGPSSGRPRQGSPAKCCGSLAAQPGFYSVHGPQKLSSTAAKNQRAMGRKSVELPGGSRGSIAASSAIKSTRAAAEDREAAELLAKLDRGIAIEEAMIAKLLERYRL